MSTRRVSDPASSTPPRVQRRTADVRAALVEAAERVLERDGLDGLTVRAVAAEAEVAPMGVYNHLHDKAGLVLAVLARAFDRLAGATTWRSDVAPAESLRAIGDAYRQLAQERPITYTLMFGARANAQTLQDIGEPADAARRQLIDAVRTAQQLGTVRAGDPELLAGAFWSALHGTVSLELSRNQPNPETNDAVFKTVLDMIVIGLAPPPHNNTHNAPRRD